MPKGRSGGRSHGRSHGHRSHGIGHRSHIGRHHHHHHHRGHYHHRPAIVIPPSTDKSIVFPYNFSTNKFDIQSFNPSLTNHKINSDEIQAFLTEIQSGLTPYHQARSPRAVKFLSWLILLFIIAIAVVIPLSIINSKRDPEVITTTYRSRYGGTVTYTETNNVDVFPIGIPIVVGIFVVYMIFYVIMRSVYSQKAENKLKEIRPSLQQYINERGSQWNERGFMWMIPGHFPHWIELENLEALKAIGIDPLLYGNFSVAQKIQMMGNAAPGAIQISGNFNGNMSGNMVTPTPGMNLLQMFIQPQQVDQVQQNQYSQFQQQQNQPYGQSQQQQQPTQGIYMQNQFNGNTFNNNQGGFYA